MRRGIAIVAVGFLALGAAAAQPAETARPASAGVYTTAQASRGRVLYVQQCASCHGGSLSGADMAPPLASGAFLASWSGRGANDLAFRIRATMPLDDPGSLSPQATSDIIAYMLQANGYQPGSVELPFAGPPLAVIRMDDPAGR